MDTVEDAEHKSSFLTQVRSLPANFWYANFMEIIERLAFFGVRAIAPLYLVKQAGENGLGLSYVDKGNIYSVWALIQCLVPMVSGGFTERYGYKKSLAVAFVINIAGYLCMAQSRPLATYFAGLGWDGAGFWVFLTAACLVALGTAIFKPPCHGTIAKTTTEETSSMGWGLFYWVVNIGGALAPMLAAQLRGEINWNYVFYAAAIVTACNFLPLIFLYREPEKTPPKEGEDAGHKGPLETFLFSIATIFKDLRLVVFLLIFSCFWLMFMQLWDLLPNFIDEWVDTSDVAPAFGWVGNLLHLDWVLESGQTKPEILINIDAWAIIALVLVISWMVRKINKVAAMIIGMVISLVGFVGAGMTMLGWLCSLMIFVFAIGEMACSPTFSAYVGLIAPKDKKALYMGYSNIPFAIGWALGNFVGGYFYQAYGARDTLAMQHLASEPALIARAAPTIDWSDALQKLPPLLELDRDQAFETLRDDFGVDAAALRDTFRHDHGQIVNLALHYYALRDENRDATAAGLTKVLHARAQELAADAENFGGKVRQVLESIQAGETPAPTTIAATSQPDASEVLHPPSDRAVLAAVDEVVTLAGRLRRLAAGEIELEDIDLARYAHLLPEAVGHDRDEILAELAEQLNKGVPDDATQGITEISEMLWSELGDDPGVLDNLALEYFAQSTDRLRNNLAALPVYATKTKQRVREVQHSVGITSSKAFDAIAAAVVSDSSKLDAALAAVHVESTRPADRLYVYLAQQGQFRYDAITRRDWKHDRTFLRELIRGDARALQIVLAEIDRPSLADWFGKLFGGADIGYVTEEGVNYYKLADKPELIQKALREKDWTCVPEQAAALMALNPREAGALAAADVKQAQQILWDAYHPYMVWIYLGAIGLAGTLGMVVFYFAAGKPQPAPNEAKA